MQEKLENTLTYMSSSTEILHVMCKKDYNHRSHYLAFKKWGFLDWVFCKVVKNSQNRRVFV